MSLLEEAFLSGVYNKESPNSPKWVEWVHISKGLSHCETCLKLDKCWFVDKIKPRLPQHQHCHCTTMKLSLFQVYDKIETISKGTKFDPYLFNTKNEYTHNKEKLFKSWGYDFRDAKWMQKEVEKQALEKYVMGEYVLGKLDEYGQRISIRIEIPRKDKNEKASFITGWMVGPEGKIELTTPFGGE